MKENPFIFCLTDYIIRDSSLDSNGHLDYVADDRESIMSSDVTFSDEIDNFEDALKQKKEKLEKLKQQRDAHAQQTRKARRALEDLRAVLRGETPPSERDSDDDTTGISAVPVDPETKRPGRGERRKQIRQICLKVGADGEQFRTADVLNVLREVEDEVTTGMRSYTYTVMNALEDDNFVERVGRGKWVLDET